MPSEYDLYDDSDSIDAERALIDFITDNRPDADDLAPYLAYATHDEA